MREELAALRARGGGIDDESGASSRADHVTFSAYLEKRREGKHQEAKSLIKRAMRPSEKAGVDDHGKGSHATVHGGGRPRSPTAAAAPAKAAQGSVAAAAMAPANGREARPRASASALAALRGGTGGAGDDIVGAGPHAGVRHGRRRSSGGV